MAKQYDGSDSLIKTFNTMGEIQYSENVIARGDYVEITTLLQRNYKIIQQERVSISSKSAIAAARAILKHFGEEV